MRCLRNLAVLWMLCFSLAFGQDGGGLPSELPDLPEVEAEAASEPLEVTMLKNQAETGDADALYRLAELYDLGDTVAQNQTLATEYYLHAMAKGNAKAASYMGFRYIEGLGVERDAKKGWQILNDGIRAGDPWVLSGVAMAFWLGIDGLPQNRDRAIDYMRRAAKDSKENQAVLLFMLYDCERWEEAKVFENRESTENLEFLRAIFMIHAALQRKNTPENRREAVETGLQIASEMPESPLLQIYAALFAQTTAEAENNAALAKRAFDMLERTRNAGMPLALSALADCYWDGKGTTADRAQAEALYRQAAESGDRNARLQLVKNVELPRGDSGRLAAKNLLLDSLLAPGRDDWEAGLVLAALYFEENRDTEAAAVLEKALAAAVTAREKWANDVTRTSFLKWHYEGGGRGGMTLDLKMDANDFNGKPRVAPEGTIPVRTFLEKVRAGEFDSVPWSSLFSAEIPQLLADCYRDGRGVEPNPAREKELRKLAEEWKK